MQLVLNNDGAVIDIGKLHIRRKSARKILESVKSTLDLMGIKYKNIKGSMYLGVPTQAQLEKEKANAATVNSLLNFTRGGRQSGKSYFSGIDFGSKDKNAIAQIQGQKIKFIVMDDAGNTEIK